MTRPGRGPIVLASRSPRRRRILADLGFEVSVCPVDVDEESVVADRRTDPGVAALAIARVKAAAAVGRGVVMTLVAADTVVEGPDGLVGAPQSRSDAVGIVSGLSRASLRVATGVVVVTADGSAVGAVRLSTVTLGPIDRTAAAAYVATGAADDTAAGLELQGRGSGFVAAVEGCWTNVVGLPVCVVLALTGSQPTDSQCRDRDGAPCRAVGGVDASPVEL
ncbi:MAG: Maf family protein [Acidimicrobiales bacterium]